MPVVTHVHEGGAEGFTCERLNSFDDFRALLGGRHAPPMSSSRFSGFNTTESAEVNSKTLKQATDKREEAFLAIGSMQPSTPNSGSPRSRSHNRRFSESGSQTPFLRSPADQADACFQQISTGGQDSIASPSLRRRRATDMGYSTSTMQAVIDKRGLRHLSSATFDIDTPWPKSLSLNKALMRRRHTTDGTAVCNAQGGTSENSESAVSSSRPRCSTFIATPPVPEECSIIFPDDDKPARQTKISYLERTVFLLTSKLAEASMREQMLQLQVNEMQSQLMSTSSPEMIRLGNENQELRKQNEALKADLARKTRLIESAVLPMVNDKEALLEGTGPLRRALDDKQLSALLEMASLGASPQDMHRLLLGKSETGANLKPFISLAGRLRTVFENAQDEETTVNALESTAMPLTRGKMVQVLRENKISILSDTVEHGLLAEVSFALLSGVDPWSIVNLLDGRISRNSTMDLTVVPELFGVLADADPSEFGTDSPMVSTLEKLSRRCSLCPLQALRQANLELEQSNIALEAQLGDLNNLMAVRQCKWTEKGAPALSPVDLWRLDSIGSNATSSPKQA